MLEHIFLYVVIGVVFSGLIQLSSFLSFKSWPGLSWFIIIAVAWPIALIGVFLGGCLVPEDHEVRK